MAGEAPPRYQRGPGRGVNRAPFVQDSALVLTAVDEGRAEGLVAAHTITTAYYVTAKIRDVQVATAAISKLLGIVDVIAADRADLLRAISLGWRDFEDAVQAVSAEKIAADAIVTRDPKDFQGATTTVRSPAEVLALL
jgi:predicted nucleic acid-binding protein